MMKDNPQEEGCTHFHEFMKAEKIFLLKKTKENNGEYPLDFTKNNMCLDVAQKYLSDVDKWAGEFRKEYCNNLCPYKNICTFKDKKG